MFTSRQLITLDLKKNPNRKAGGYVNGYEFLKRSQDLWLQCDILFLGCLTMK